MKPGHVTIMLETPEATQAFGRLLAPYLKGGDIISLQGDLGTGKTTLARHIIQSLGGPDHIPSPTYNLVHIYEAADFDIWHADLYRLKSTDDINEIGLMDMVSDPSALCLIEWPDIMMDFFPQDHFKINLRSVRESPELSRELSLSLPKDRSALINIIKAHFPTHQSTS